MILSPNDPTPSPRRPLEPRVESAETRFDRTAVRSVKYTFGMALVGIVLVAIPARGNFAIAVLFALSVTAVGVMFGFLFGIPRSAANSEVESSGDPGNHAPARRTTKRQLQAAPIEQIADWLTKILLGAGLTQLDAIQFNLQRLAVLGGSCLELPATSAGVAKTYGLGMIGYFAVVGFLGGNLCTRMVLARLLRAADIDVAELEEIAAARGRVEGRRELASAISAQQITEQVAGQLPQDATAGLTAAADKGVNEQKFIAEARDWKPAGKPTVNNDPHKGCFGGLPEAGGRRLSAQVVPLGAEGDIFRVMLRVSATDGTSVTGVVKFFLHPTFRPDTAVVSFKNGIAELELIAWGAFTVGAITDGGKTLLELDLADLATAPALFRSR